MKPGETTKDGKLSVLTARCIGSCGLAPAVVFDGDVGGKLSAERCPRARREVDEPMTPEELNEIADRAGESSQQQLEHTASTSAWRPAAFPAGSDQVKAALEGTRSSATGWTSSARSRASAAWGLCAAGPLVEIDAQASQVHVPGRAAPRTRRTSCSSVGGQPVKQLQSADRHARSSPAR